MLRSARYGRYARNGQKFASARKTEIDRGLTYEQARNMCEQFNSNRTKAQEKRGTKYEFTALENWR